jgi:hypothetical protein
MSLSREDAAEALRLVTQAGQRSATLRRYQGAAPHLILWGCVYAVAYTFGYFRPQQAWLAWAILVPAAAIGDALIARRDRGANSWRPFLAIFTLFVAFIVSTGAIMQPRDPAQMSAFIPLVVATVYVALGMAIGRRFVITGVALGALTLTGFFALHSIFMLWMGIVGGAALILGGFWLKRV